MNGMKVVVKVFVFVFFWGLYLWRFCCYFCGWNALNDIKTLFDEVRYKIFTKQARWGREIWANMRREGVVQREGKKLKIEYKLNINCLARDYWRKTLHVSVIGVYVHQQGRGLDVTS